MKTYDEIWAADSRAVRDFFDDHPGDVSVIPLPEKKIGAMKLPQTRIIIKGDNADITSAVFSQIYESRRLTKYGRSGYCGFVLSSGETVLFTSDFHRKQPLRRRYTSVFVWRR